MNEIALGFLVAGFYVITVALLIPATTLCVFWLLNKICDRWFL